MKKRSTEKKTPWERLPNATDWKIYACSDMDLGEVLFHYVVFCDEENRDLPSKIYRVSFVEFPKICCTVKYICALPGAC